MRGSHKPAALNYRDPGIHNPVYEPDQMIERGDLLQCKQSGFTVILLSMPTGKDE